MLVVLDTYALSDGVMRLGSRTEVRSLAIVHGSGRQQTLCVCAPCARRRIGMSARAHIGSDGYCVCTGGGSCVDPRVAVIRGVTTQHGHAAANTSEASLQP